ncbi:hypothetical protein ANABIO32_25390 [Rossellomorea marisflavi]|nr:hypothetical protein ANABIO32_25390 [Rossellomorea marisflavi]
MPRFNNLNAKCTPSNIPNNPCTTITYRVKYMIIFFIVTSFLDDILICTFLNSSSINKTNTLNQKTNEGTIVI